jgi:GNAT superfamily N-acetyltransferase
MTDLHGASIVAAAQPLTVRRLRDEDIPETAALLARAMHDDPAYAFLFSDRQRRGAGLRAFFAGNLRLHLGHGCTHVGCDASGRVWSTVTLRPPGGIDASTREMLRAGLRPFARAHGLGAVRRLLWLKSSYEAIEFQASRGRLHRLVHMMAVDPEWQHRGRGSAILATVLASASGDGLPVYLTTHTEPNVRFYRRAGFGVQCERMLSPPRSEPYSVWTMRMDSKAL